MTKLFLAALLALTATAQAAPLNKSLTVEYNHETVHGTDKINNLSLVPGYTFDNGVKLDVRLTGSQTQEANQTAVGIEPRVKYLVPVTKELNVGARASVGQLLQNGDNYGFYTVEPTAEYTLSKDWTLMGSVKYTDTFGGSTRFSPNLYTGTTYGIGAGYAVSSTSSITAQVYTRNNNEASTNSTGVTAAYNINW